jgi:hypothetical protein
MKSVYRIVRMEEACLPPGWVKVFLILSCFLHALFMTFIWTLLPRGFPWFSRPFIESGGYATYRSGFMDCGYQPDLAASNRYVLYRHHSRGLDRNWSHCYIPEHM